MRPQAPAWLHQAVHAANHYANMHDALVAAGATVIHDEYTLADLDLTTLFLHLEMSEVSARELAVQWADGRAQCPDDTYIPPVLRAP